jgi:hypothetical protein
MRDDLETEYFLDVHERQWFGGMGQPAGIYWLNGHTSLAAHGSGAEDRLLAEGAILVATLLFDRDPLEGRVPGRAIERVRSRDLTQHVSRS